MNCMVAIGQIDPVLGDVAKNVSMHQRETERALRDGAHVIVFPELSLTGYGLKDLAADVAIDPAADDVLAPLRKLSKRITIIAGAAVVGDNHGVYNAGICMDGGEVVHVHRKVYPPDYGMFEEGRYFSAGRSVEAFDTKHGRFGILICEDMWHPALPYLATADGAHALFSLTASPTRVGASKTDLDNKTVNYDHMRVYARLYSLYVVFANRIGFEDGVNFWGGSAVFGPSGDVVAEAPLFEPSLLLAHLTDNDIRRARRLSRHVIDERPDIVLSNLRRIIERPGQ